MPWNRQDRKGSFGGHFEELVKHFPERAAEQDHQPHERPSGLQEKIDIHAMLFERAWELDRESSDGAS